MRGAARPCMTTIGQLISELLTQYERKLHDHELAAVATEVTLNDMLRARQRAAKPVTSARPARVSSRLNAA